VRKSIILHDHEARVKNPLVVRPVVPTLPDNPTSISGQKWGFVDGAFYYCGRKSPYKPGDVLAVRESWLTYMGPITDRLLREGADTWPFIDMFPFQFATEEYGQLLELGWERRSPATMPLIYSRRSLRVKSVECKLVSEITEEEAKAAGVTLSIPHYGVCAVGDVFEQLWNKRYGKRYPWETAWGWFTRCEEV